MSFNGSVRMPSGVVLTALALGVATVAGAAPPLSGAIFTTTEDGTIVNENTHYTKKTDVYLDGGPGPHAPSGAAGLPEGDYYFQVTDPSGKDLLSEDHISCRKIHVGADGFITEVYAGTNEAYSKSARDWVSEDCLHEQGVDIDYGPDGAITVQLYPYEDTPNPGGVYKVWITPTDDYIGEVDLSCVGEGKDCSIAGEYWEPGNYHGFVPAASKTDNYKVKRTRIYPALITVSKFNDANMDGDPTGEEYVTGWAVDAVDPLGGETTEYTTAYILAAESGTYAFTEALCEGTLQTVSILDDDVLSFYPDADPYVEVEVAGTSGETHDVVFGNVGWAEIDPCKVYDVNGNGVWDEGEETIPGWRFTLSGYDVLEHYVEVEITTGSDGCGEFPAVLPGSYTIEESMPVDDGVYEWFSSVSTPITVEVESIVDGPYIVAEVTMSSSNFLNYAFGYADFDTKGYWHNKNGMNEITDEDIDYVNGLLPYMCPSDYFDDGDEPFDGAYEDASCVEAAYSDDDSLIWGACEDRAEISLFLVDSDEGFGSQDQLAQQLLAFLFNVRHRLLCDDPADAWFEYEDGSYNAGALIDAAIDAWASGDETDWNAYSSLIDGMNNSDSIPFIPCEPPEFSF
ncbi:MAG: hypothetical protein JXB39_12035 [Deltaproteobacteria bacterium]|nr:hypothetical protein [Deltaproteobacteria bacterium]